MDYNALVSIKQFSGDENNKTLLLTTFGEEQIDQQLSNTNTSAGFGEFNGTRYRGQGFTAGLSGILTAIAFKLSSVGSKGMKVFIYQADNNFFPTGLELYSFTIPNSSLSANLTKYSLPVPLSVQAGTKYVFYLAPWDTNSNTYSDDYRDLGSNNTNSYTGGTAVSFSGSWNVESNLDHAFQTYIKQQVPVKAMLVPAGNEILALNPELPVGQGYTFIILSDTITNILPESEIDVVSAMNNDLSTSDVFIVKGQPRKNKVLGQIHFSGVCVKKN